MEHNCSLLPPELGGLEEWNQVNYVCNIYKQVEFQIESIRRRKG